MPAIIAAEKESQPPIQSVQLQSSSELVIVFDWDDTLLCSTFLQSHNFSLHTPIYDLTRPLVESDSESVKVQRDIALQLKELETGVVALLRQASQSSHKVVIVTNAESGWVQLSAAKFLPSVVPLLDTIQVISARSTFEHLFPESVIKWKYFAMHTVLVQSGFFGRDGRPHVMKHVVSFGDSHVEREAVRAVCRNVPSTRTKSVKFAERPTGEQLRRQIELVIQCFEYITTHNADLDLQLSINLNPSNQDAAGATTQTTTANTASDGKSAPSIPDTTSVVDADMDMRSDEVKHSTLETSTGSAECAIKQKQQSMVAEAPTNMIQV